MNFRISDTFTASLARLSGEEQKAFKTTAFDLKLNPANPGMSFHKLDKARDKNFWSVRVSSDIRLIVHRSADSLLLCYVDHHDKVTNGPNGVVWRRTPRPAQRSGWRGASVSTRSLFARLRRLSCGVRRGRVPPAGARSA